MTRYDEKDNFNRVLRRDNPSHVPTEGSSRGGAYRGAWPGDARPGPGVDRWRDEWGVGWTDLDGEVFPTDPAVDSFEKVDRITSPDPDAPGRMDALDKTLPEMDRDRHFLSVGHPYFLYEKAINILGPEEFAVSLLAGPDEAHTLLDKIVGFELGIAARYVAYRPEHINLSDDYGHQDRLAISPDCWRTFFKPRIKRVIDFYRDQLGPDITVSLHSCGHVMPILADFVELGIDVLHPVQTTANDLPELRRITSGRITLAGGIDGQHVLPSGTPEDVRREVFTKCNLLWEGGGYLPMPEKLLGVPPENKRAMDEAIAEWSRRHVERPDAPG